MTPRLPELLSLLSTLDQADTAATQLLRLDAGSAVDVLAEVLSKAIEDMRTAVQNMLGE